MEWTAQAIEDLLWWHAHTGSMQELADKLGVSKGTVCGKLFRLGYTTTTQGSITRARNLVEKRTTATAQPIEGGVALLDLKPRHCRWPLSNGNAMPVEERFCGARKTADSSYCAAHKAKGITPMKPREDRKRFVLRRRKIGVTF